jgi:predicted ATPase/DNA-binding XRE family transcriptional regulator
MSEAETLFGDLLREYRVAAGLTQEALAERAGLSTRGISDLERTIRRAPRRDTIRLLAEALSLAGPERAALAAAAVRPRAMKTTPGTAPAGTISEARLPTPASSFIGRASEIEEVRTLLRTRRLVTLLGPGGCGKTRLAIEALRDVAGDYPDGACMVELAGVTTHGWEAQAVAATLGLRDQPGGTPSASLVRYLAPRRMVLLLDNCEHLIAGCAALAADLLARCPSLTILATSRAALNIAGEARFLVPALQLPPPGATGDLEQLAGFAAVRLFLDRAASVAPGFTLTAANAQAVVTICQRLDGLPLAIELAAARARVLAVQQIEVRLADRFTLLGSGSRSAPPRQQALRTLLDWSYDLLSPTEQALCRRLAVFAGGCTLEAAEAVCAAGDVAEGDALDLLAQLVDKSLVTAIEARGEARFQMLETIQLYAREKLDEAGERSELERKHSTFYLDFAELASRHTTGPHQAWWLRRLRADYSNLHVVLERSMRTGEALVGLRLAVALWPMWSVHGRFSEAAYWLERALAQSEDAPPALRAQGLAAAGRADLRRGLLDAAVARCTQALELRRELGQPEWIADVLLALGSAAGMRGDYDRARGAFTEALELYREIGHRQGLASALANVGYVAAHQGDLDTATAHLDEALARFRDLGNARGAANALENLGMVAVASDDLTAALARYRESLRLFQELDDARGITRCLERIATIMELRGLGERSRLLRDGAARLRATTDAGGRSGSTEHAVWSAPSGRADQGGAAPLDPLPSERGADLALLLDAALTEPPSS